MSSGVMVLRQRASGWRRIHAPPKPERPNVIGWDALNNKPNGLDSAYLPKTAFRFPPRSFLGVSFSKMSPGRIRSESRPGGMSARIHVDESRQPPILERKALARICREGGIICLEFLNLICPG